MSIKINKGQFNFSPYYGSGINYNNENQNKSGKYILQICICLEHYYWIAFNKLQKNKNI